MAGTRRWNLFGVVMCLCLRLQFCNSTPATRRKLPLASVRPVYGCVGADRPEAQLFIDEVDGILVYTCPACRRAMAEAGHASPQD
jgi:hypothetical protein